MISRELLAEYNRHRDRKACGLLCHAPFSTVNFAQNGDLTPCCYNRDDIFGTYPDESLIEIWFGKKAQQVREMIHNGILPPGCKYCIAEINNHNFAAVKARGYDHLAEQSYPESPADFSLFPKALEFEISSTCNLQCIMCTGYYSSSIRRHREGLPVFPSVYDQAFVDQLADFLPHLFEAKFLGGEPFLTKAYFQIWPLLARANPRVKVIITTNGTILNKRVRKLLEIVRTHLVVSIDSLQKNSYEEIRRKASFATTMANLDFFRRYALTHNTSLSLAVCPMQHNWTELPGILAFCNTHNLGIFFNMVLGPDEVALHSLKVSELIRIIEFLKDYQPPETTPASIANNRAYRAMVEQVADGMRLNNDQLLIFETLQRSMISTLAGRYDLPEEVPLETILTRYLIQTAYGHYRYDPITLIPDSAYWSDRRLVFLNGQIAASFKNILACLGSTDFARFFFPVLQAFVSRLPRNNTLFDTDRVVGVLDQFLKNCAVLPDLTSLMGDMVGADIMFVLQLFNDLSIECLLSAATSRYAKVGQP